MLAKLFQKVRDSKATTTLSGLGVVLTSGASYLYLQNKTNSAEASESGLHPPNYPWNHRFPWQAYDHHSIRRGFQVYKQVCATCHSLDRVAFRHLVNSCYTEEEAKALAAEIEVTDGPDMTGDMFQRPGRLADYMPKPYANKKAARYSNNGALPPDLSLISYARHGGENYIFALLTGYREAPHGIEMRPGLYYNPYFPGGAIAMPPGLTDGQIEFDDGTPASISQMAKDVSTFLAWTSAPEQDDRRRMAMKFFFIWALLLAPTYYVYRYKWAPVKTRVISFIKQ